MAVITVLPLQTIAVLRICLSNFFIKAFSLINSLLRSFLLQNIFYPGEFVFYYRTYIEN